MEGLALVVSQPMPTFVTTVVARCVLEGEAGPSDLFCGRWPVGNDELLAASSKMQDDMGQSLRNTLKHLEESRAVSLALASELWPATHQAR